MGNKWVEDLDSMENVFIWPRRLWVVMIWIFHDFAIEVLIGLLPGLKLIKKK